jgi:hypothetical protein
MRDLIDLPLDGWLIRTVHDYDYTSAEPPQFTHDNQSVRIVPVCGEPFDVPAEEVVGVEFLPAG